MESFFDGFKVRYVPRLDNQDADHLAWLASPRSAIPDDVIQEVLTKPSVALACRRWRNRPYDHRQRRGCARGRLVNAIFDVAERRDGTQ